MKALQQWWCWMGQCVICAQQESQQWWQKGEMKVTPFSFLDAPIAAVREDERHGASLSYFGMIDDSQLSPKNTTI